MFPKDLDFKMPPEWAEHQRTFIEWPVKDSACWPENYEAVCRSFADIAKAIAQFEPVTMLVNPDAADKAGELCGPEVEVLILEHNDSWVRDNGPTFIISNKGQIAGVSWKFNAWGEKYPSWELDDLVAPKLLTHLGIPCFDAPFVLEGGSIHVDGEGTLLTTEECLLNPKRNPHLGKGEIEALLRQYLNIEKVIWLKKGLDGDETDGHIDNVACFARPGVVVMQTCEDQEDPNYQITQENMEILNNATDARGRKLEIIQIQQPPADYYNEARLTLSYLNFYFVNKGIILPVFGGRFEAFDRQAEAVLKTLFPDRTIAKVDGYAIVKEGGNVHCITQQMPAGEPAKL